MMEKKNSLTEKLQIDISLKNIQFLVGRNLTEATDKKTK